MKNNLIKAFAGCCLAGTAFGQTWDGDTSTEFANGDNWDSGVAPDGDGNWTINNVSDGTPFAPILTTLVETGPDGGGGDAFIGQGGGTGTLDVNAGGTLDSSGNWLFLGEGGGNGTLNVNDGGSVISDGDIRIDNGTLNVNDGGSVDVGGINGVNSNLTVNSGGSLVTSGNIAFPSGTSSITNSGTMTAGSETWIGNGAGNNSSVTIDGGTINSEAWIAVGRAGSTGVLNINSGNITQSTEFLALASDLDDSGAGDGTINQTGGTVSVPAARFGENGSSTGTYNISAGSFILGDDGFNIGFNNTTSGVMNISGTANIESTGTTFVGKYNESFGELNLLGSSATVVLTYLSLGLDDTGTDSGAMGTISFVADSGGISTISLSGDLNLSSPDGDFLSVDLSGMDIDSELIDILLIDGATSQGEFTNLAQGDVVPGANGGTIDYLEDGNIWLRNVQVPEPSTALLSAFGALALLRRRRS